MAICMVLLFLGISVVTKTNEHVLRMERESERERDRERERKKFVCPESRVARIKELFGWPVLYHVWWVGSRSLY
jgi:hypothetical protein